jgi:hypothetical protein
MTHDPFDTLNPGAHIRDNDGVWLELTERELVRLPEGGGTVGVLLNEVLAVAESLGGSEKEPDGDGEVPIVNDGVGVLEALGAMVGDTGAVDGSTERDAGTVDEAVEEGGGLGACDGLQVPTA